MKRFVALGSLLLAAVITGCSSPGGSSSYGMTPMTTTLPVAELLEPSTMRITGAYAVPFFGNSDVTNLIVGPDRRIWFAEFEGNAIGAMTTAGVISQYPTGSGSQPLGLAVGPKPKPKNVWTGGYGGTMTESTQTGSLTNFPIAGANIGDIVLGPDKNMWFADYGNKKLGRITTTGVVTEFPLPTGGSPDSLVVGPDHNFWIIDGGRNKIVKMNRTGAVLASYGKGFSANEYAINMVYAPDGKFYVSEYAPQFGVPDKIARVTIKGKIKEIGTLPPLSYPNRLAVGKDGNVYFVMSNLQAIGKIDLAKSKVTYHFLPFTYTQGMQAIVNGPDNRLYVAGSNAIYAISY